MAWGGTEEQAQEIVKGNHFSKNWHDEALKVIESTMQEYWQEIENAHSNINGTMDTQMSLASNETTVPTSHPTIKESLTLRRQCISSPLTHLHHLETTIPSVPAACI